MAKIAIPRLVIAGTGSGVGKTTVTVALCLALRGRGLRVRVYKCGPDYLDPTYHAVASGRTVHNLDAWMMGQEALLGTFLRTSADADIALIEGVMGVYDGASPLSNAGSTAEVARWLEAPVLLVADAGGIARTLAALVQGVCQFDPELRVAGVAANFIGSRGHLEILRQACPSPPVLGGLPKDPAHGFSERHLGLEAATAATLTPGQLDYWAAAAETWFDLDAILSMARAAPALTAAIRPAPAPAAVGSTARIGIAQDAAFSFYYEHNLELLRQAGAELIPFSPVADALLPDVGALYLGGGYPELWAAELSANASMRTAIAAFAARGGPIYAECGGFMYLTEAIVTAGGVRFPMVGLFPAEARMHTRLQALGYAEARLARDCLLGKAGARFRGHQFRYSELAAREPLFPSYEIGARGNRAAAAEGYTVQNALGSYVHAHWASNPEMARSLVVAARAFAQR